MAELHSDPSRQNKQIACPGCNLEPEIQAVLETLLKTLPLACSTEVQTLPAPLVLVLKKLASMTPGWEPAPPIKELFLRIQENDRTVV